MSHPVISIKGLGKRYQLGETLRHDTLRDSLAHGFRALLPRRRKSAAETADPADKDRNILWALKDINLEVHKGEILGIIGSNGAGKSTLLKILSQITDPTEGEIRIRGRIASLLEVGTGFHPELSGRENILLNGSILGMPQKEIRRKMDEIVAFAEVEKFLDTPVKRYSSGMYVRLAFAVAAHLDPEIMVVDEVLAVGDAAFQNKCLGKLQNVARDEGRTILFVSHQIMAISRLCQRCIWLDRGRVREDGKTNNVVAEYLSYQSSDSSSATFDPDESNPSAEIAVTGARLARSENRESSSFDAKQPLEIHIDYEVRSPVANAWIGFGISAPNGSIVFSGIDADDDEIALTPREPGNYSSVCKIPASLLNAGRYLLTVRAAIWQFGATKILSDFPDALTFEVVNSGGVGNYAPIGLRVGVISPKLQWEITPHAQSPQATNTHTP